MAELFRRCARNVVPYVRSSQCILARDHKGPCVPRKSPR